MNFNAYFISKDPYEEVDEYLRCESKGIIHHSSCSPCDWDQIGNKTCYILKVRKRISTLTDLKVSFLACNRVFYKPENAKGTPWNWILKILKYKNEIFKRVELKKYKRERGHLPLCSLLELVIKISRLAHFLIFSADDSKKSVTVRAKSLSISERCYLAHQKILWIIGIWATISKMSTLENTGVWYF